MPQDQEEASRHPGNLVVVLNGTMTDGEDPKAPFSNETDSKSPAQAETRTQLEQCKQEDTAQYGSANEERLHRQGNWTPSEILVLLEAKRKEQDIFSGSRRSVLTAEDKWKFVSDYCRTKAVQRSKEQCRCKWDNMLPDFRKVKEYEEQKGGAGESYFAMDGAERRAKLLPSGMDLEVYQRIGCILANKPTKGGLSGLKREAREKKFSEVANCADAEEATTAKPWEEGAAVAELVSRHLAAAPRRRRKRRAIDRAPEFRAASAAAAAIEPESRNNSSTEEDIPAMPGRSNGQHPAAAGCMYEEKISHRIGGVPVVAYMHDPALHRSAQNGGQAQAARAIPSEGRDDKGAASDNNTGLGDCDSRSLELLSFIEDRKDARHRELLALEREKLASFREASFTIATAMTNAIAVFSKVAEELLRRR